MGLSLVQAARDGDLEGVTAPLEADGEELDGPPGGARFCPLSKAARNGHEAVVASLLAAGATVDKEDKDG